MWREGTNMHVCVHTRAYICVCEWAYVQKVLVHVIWYHTRHASTCLTCVTSRPGRIQTIYTKHRRWNTHKLARWNSHFTLSSFINALAFWPIFCQGWAVHIGWWHFVIHSCSMFLLSLHLSIWSVIFLSPLHCQNVTVYSSSGCIVPGQIMCPVL